MFKKLCNKGQADWADFVLMVFTFIISFLLITLTFSNIGQGRANTVHDKIDAVNVQRELFVLLNSPVTVDGYTRTIADLIKLWNVDQEEYETTLENGVKEAMNHFPGICMKFSPNIESSTVIESGDPIAYDRPAACDVAVRKAALASIQEDIQVKYERAR